MRQTRTTLVGAGLGLVCPNIFLNQTKAATGENPSEFIRVGFIGVGGQGISNMRGLMKNAVAVCDVDKRHLAAAKKLVEDKNPGRTCATYDDYRKLLESKEIDVVVIECRSPPPKVAPLIPDRKDQAVEILNGKNEFTGCIFEGERGLLYVNRGVIRSWPEEILDEPIKDSDTRLYKSAQHHRGCLPGTRRA